jgi:hypothetical protein
MCHDFFIESRTNSTSSALCSGGICRRKREVCQLGAKNKRSCHFWLPMCDFLSRLPSELASGVLAHLTPDETLGSVRPLSRGWRRKVEADAQLWRMFAERDRGRDVAPFGVVDLHAAGFMVATLLRRFAHRPQFDHLWQSPIDTPSEQTTAPGESAETTPTLSPFTTEITQTRSPLATAAAEMTQTLSTAAERAEMTQTRSPLATAAAEMTRTLSTAAERAEMTQTRSPLATAAAEMTQTLSMAAEGAEMTQRPSPLATAAAESVEMTGGSRLEVTRGVVRDVVGLERVPAAVILTIRGRMAALEGGGTVRRDAAFCAQRRLTASTAGFFDLYRRHARAWRLTAPESAPILRARAAIQTRAAACWRLSETVIRPVVDVCVVPLILWLAVSLAPVLDGKEEHKWLELLAPLWVLQAMLGAGTCALGSLYAQRWFAVKRFGDRIRRHAMLRWRGSNFVGEFPFDRPAEAAHGYVLLAQLAFLDLVLLFWLAFAAINDCDANGLWAAPLLFLAPVARKLLPKPAAEAGRAELMFLQLSWYPMASWLLMYAYFGLPVYAWLAFLLAVTPTIITLEKARYVAPRFHTTPLLIALRHIRAFAIILGWFDLLLLMLNVAYPNLVPWLVPLLLIASTASLLTLTDAVNRLI